MTAGRGLTIPGCCGFEIGRAGEPGATAIAEPRLRVGIAGRRGALEPRTRRGRPVDALRQQPGELHLGIDAARLGGAFEQDPGTVAVAGHDLPLDEPVGESTSRRGATEIGRAFEPMRRQLRRARHMLAGKV